ncbi:mpv17-like protein [Oratosquilla oratoria]|uniref:mpv17-like protein n=1 Tax=Oratosquilla oratoria TaxID=337810 RepID=UPI003F76774F
MMLKMRSRLKNLMNSKPLMRDMVVYGSLYMGAEFSQQFMLKNIVKDPQHKNYNIESVGRYAFFGIAWYPVIYHYWYKWLDAQLPGTSAAVVCIKSLVDQFVMEPPLIVSFYTGMSIMERKESLTAECREKFIPTFTTGCIFWLPAMAVNFYFMPNSMRVIFLAVCQFFWCNFICWYKRL